MTELIFWINHIIIYNYDCYINANKNNIKYMIWVVRDDGIIGVSADACQPE